ncbi:Crp/Fnr family transcriptional regulator [Enterobacter hormaechei]|uniref:helix-turn-helix domain-containing protein n=1 Tax=Enterobacter hormaechei TaxID=158836 RepID=UPI000FDB3B26|nr:helix-turn-helix domain-containing protein [Enterobacter hormaechei]RVQ79683.1 Crp/Fnr family transcriptional regulator [Enterobacter hormaechei]
MSSDKPSHRGSRYAQELISHLQPHCTTHKTDPCEQLDLQVNGQSMCYLILDGTVAIYRRSDDMMLSTARSPALFGLANLTDIYFTDYLRTVTPCLIGVLTTERVAEIIKEKALWGLLSNHLMFVYNRLYHNVMPKGAPTAYEMIRQQLVLLMQEDDSYRRSVTAERYIRDKTQLSRSGVMRILADLKTGGFIEMEEGRLIKINKLPARY